MTQFWNVLPRFAAGLVSIVFMASAAHAQALPQMQSGTETQAVPQVEPIILLPPVPELPNRNIFESSELAVANTPQVRTASGTSSVQDSDKGAAVSPELLDVMLGGGTEGSDGSGILQDQQLPRPQPQKNTPAPEPPQAGGEPIDPLQALPGHLLVPGESSLPQLRQVPAVGSSLKGQQTLKAPKYDGLPSYVTGFGKMPGPQTDVLAKQVPYDPGAFIPSPMAPVPYDAHEESLIYRGKHAVWAQRPIVEWWRPLFGSGIYPPARNWFGRYNLVMPHFMVYGDFRTGVGVNRNQSGDANSLAFRANLDMDLEITATERVHAFMTPLNRGGSFTRLDFTDSAQFINGGDLRLDTLFFEGDAGAIWGGWTGQDGAFDLPFSLGLIPFFYQNGIWANDAALGAAVALPSKHNRLLNWSNFDATFFWASDQVDSDAFLGDNNAAEFFGTAWFIEANDGYWEVDYAFVHDDVGQHRSYHNFSVAFTRRYLTRLSNSIRFVTNFDQALPRDQRTAQGHLLLIENSLISRNPNTFVPYFNLWYGQGRTQSLARAGGTGGILNNVGINFESDGLTGYPTLDATGVNTVGGAVGLNLLGHNFSHQLVLEVAGLKANGSAQFRNAAGDQYAAGIRYQRPINNAWIFRTDHMFGFLRGAEDIRGSRVELRFKF